MGTSAGKVVTAPEVNPLQQLAGLPSIFPAETDVPDYLSFQLWSIPHAVEAAIRDYIGIGYENINRYLRGQLSTRTATGYFRERFEEVRRQTNTLLRVFDRYARGLQEDRVVWRRTGNHEHLPENLRVGSILRNRGFISTSLDPHFRNPNVVIRVPKGTRVIGGAQEYESELILRHATRLKYLGRNVKGQRVFDVLPPSRQSRH